MSYVGKILVIVQVALSLLFMAYAGAVYAVHANWQAKYEAAKSELDLIQKSKGVVEEELIAAKREFETQLTEQTQKAADATALNTTLQGQVANLTQTNNLIEQQRETQAGLAEAKAREARFRQEEAEQQRVENKKLQATLDKTAAELRELKDQLFTKTQELSLLTKTYDELLEVNAYLTRVVAANKLETDPRVVEKMELPPPPVEGLVTVVKKNRANRVQYVEISIGSDDGLVKNHELSVVRMPADGQDAEWLGSIRLVEVSPDSAVGEVVGAAKNGIIQEGDNVTSKL